MFASASLTATTEASVHGEHKRRIVAPQGEDTVFSSIFGPERPHFNPMRLQRIRKADDFEALFVQRAAAICRRNMRQEKVRDALVGVDLVFDPGEAVTFILVNLVVDGSAALLDGIHHLLRF